MNADARVLHELSRRVAYHGALDRAVDDLTEVDQDRLRVAAETILARLSATDSRSS